MPDAVVVYFATLVVPFATLYLRLVPSLGAVRVKAVEPWQTKKWALPSIGTLGVEHLVPDTVALSVEENELLGVILTLSETVWISLTVPAEPTEPPEPDPPEEPLPPPEPVEPDDGA